MMRMVVALALVFLMGCTSRSPNETVLAPSRSVAIERLLPTPGFHLHVTQDGTFLIDGRTSTIPSLENAIQASFNMVDSASISILLSLQEEASVPADIRRLISAPGIDVYSLRQVEVE